MTRIQRSVCQFALALGLTLNACGDDDAAAPAMQYVAGSSGSNTSNSSAATTTLIIENLYPDITITGVYVSRSTQNLWGPNQLSDVIVPGATFTLRGIPCDSYYDVKFTRTGGATIIALENIYLSCNQPRTIVLQH